MGAQSLPHIFTLANAFKEGDLLVGGTADDRVREEARRALASTTAGDIRRAVFVDDALTESLQRARDRRFDDELDALTVEQVKRLLLDVDGARWARQRRDALASEVIAGVAKVMTNDELSRVARQLCHPPDGAGVAIGSRQHLGSRIQPNSPGDDETEILFSILEGLTYGCGDVVIGLNPAADEVETIARLEDLLERVVRYLELPTRYCVLSDIVKQQRARARAPVDVAFQSLAGTSKALVGMVGLDVDGVASLAREFNGLYFETGQGSEVTNGTAQGIDMVTLEARTYGLARHLRNAAGGRWTIVNDVAGFIGPEVFRTAEQLERACLEDVVMARLHGLTMGLDVCATFHMGIAPAELRRLTWRLADLASPAYLMAVAGNADPMLGYLTTSFREHPSLRARCKRRMTSAMEQRLQALGAATVESLYARYARAAGDRRPSSVLEAEARQRVGILRERGFDLGMDDAAANARLEAIYANARQALFATVDEGVVRDASPRSIHVRTTATSRDDYLAHPPSGERLREEDALTVSGLHRARRPEVQVVVSDGLNATAINEQLRNVLPPLRRRLAADGRHVGDTDVIVRNGRVRAGYEIGGCVGAEVVIHIIGERPGTGLNSASAYVTYGRDESGQPRWSRELDHSATTAVCGIHPKGKRPEDAVSEIARTVARIVEQRKSGVALKTN